MNDALAAALGRDPGGRIAARRIASGCGARDAQSLVLHLWRVLGVRGDTESYDDASNSFVGEVVERRRGIPITLAVLALGVAEELGIGLVGVGMPGHFLLRERDGDRRFFDLFHGPDPLDEEGCRRLHASVTGDHRWDPAFLDPVGPQAITLRTLTNLKSVFRRTGEVRSLRRVMLLRRTFLGDAERGEFARMMAPTN